MNWAIPCALWPPRVVGPTAFGLKRLSCQINRAKNSNGSSCVCAADSTSRQIEADVEVGGADSGSVWLGLSSRSGPGGTDDCSGTASPHSPESSSFEIAAGKAYPRMAKNNRRLTTPQKALMSWRSILPLVQFHKIDCGSRRPGGSAFPGVRPQLSGLQRRIFRIFRSEVLQGPVSARHFPVHGLRREAAPV